MKTIYFSETLFDFQRTTRSYIAEDITPEIFPSLKFPRQCPLVHMREVKALGSEEDKGNRLLMSKGKKLNGIFTAYEQNVCVNFLNAALG
jgi:hypothetical protein